MEKGKHKYLVPSSRLGKLSIWLIILFFLLLIISSIVVKIQGPIANQTFFSNPILSIPMLLAGVCAISSFFTGIIGIIWKKERCIFVFISSLIGLLVLWFVAGEILLPH